MVKVYFCASITSLIAVQSACSSKYSICYLILSLWTPILTVSQTDIWASTWDFGTCCICAKASFKWPCRHIQQDWISKFLVSAFFYFYNSCTHGRSEDSGETVHVRRLSWAFAACWCVYQNLVWWPSVYQDFKLQKSCQTVKPLSDLGPHCLAKFPFMW